jgi:hypothetical protein
MENQSNNLREETTDLLTAALFWYQYGFKVIPILPGSKIPAIKRRPWLKNLSVRKIHAHWASHPDHEVGCILGHDLIMFETNNLDYEYALGIVEEDFDQKPKLEVNTAKGVQHYFRCAQGIMLKSTLPLYFTDMNPVGIHVKTSGDLIILPPSRGKSISILEAENTDELSVVSQEFIDEIYHLNGMVSPSEIGRKGELKPCKSDYEIQFDDFWATVRLDCDGQGADCDNCPVRPGFINLQQIRW